MIKKQNNKFLSPDRLPKLKSNSFRYNGEVGYTGSLIKTVAPMTRGVTLHMGIIYGFDTKGRLWIIENNVGGIRIVPLLVFLGGDPAGLYDIELMKDESQIPVIMKRVFERAKLAYHYLNNSCETFVNYALYGKVENVTTDAFKAITDITLFAVGVNAVLSGDKDLKEQYFKFRKDFKRVMFEKIEK